MDEKKDDQHALSFLKEGDSIEKVARCMELPIEHVKKLAEQLEKQETKGWVNTHPPYHFVNN